MTTAGSAPPDEEQWVEGLSDNMRILRISVAPQGCEATLSLSLSGRRSSATYYSAGVCWSGAALSGHAALMIEGDARRTWTINRTYPPPDRIGWCPTEEDPIPWYSGGNDTWHDLFSEVLGDSLTNLTTWVNVDTRRYWDSCSESSFTEHEVRTVASLLSGSMWQVTLEWLAQCPPDQAEKESLLPLVPYLIALLTGTTSGADAEVVLEGITGTSFSSQEDWWAWWEERQQG
ncbi:MAG: hypothetical protein A2135_07335 [Actinobacteria bacterium RBG_16_67_15]|nr:MAG: hypothetical protein A2135_07335 [Actinobacteria bacterium RBG_16_67_15]